MLREPHSEHTPTFLGLDRRFITAHRGGSDEVLENSRAAFERAHRAGFALMETDVHASRDQVAVISHDPTLDRNTEGRGPIADHDWSELARTKDNAGHRLIRLEDVLADYPDMRLNIDIKVPEALTPTLDAIARAGAAERICLSSFSESRMVRVRQLMPHITTSLGTAAVARLVLAAGRPAPIRRRLARFIPRPDGPEGQRAQAIQVPRAHRAIPVVTPAVIRYAHELGLQVHVWTIDQAEEMTELWDMGVDAIVTDRPTLGRQVLGEWQRRRRAHTKAERD